MKGARAVLVLSTLSVFWSGCTSKIEVHETLEWAREKTIVGWVPVERGAIRWVPDLEGALKTGVLQVRLEREEIPVFRVKDAVVRRETITRAYQPPYRTPEENQWIAGLMPLLFPLAVVGCILLLCHGLPDRYYGPGISETIRVEVDEGEFAGGPESKAWRGIPSVAVHTDPARERYVTDPEGGLRINLVPWLREGDFQFVLKAVLEGAPEHAVRISTHDVSQILREKK
jgi:hypothetical protein